jgi:transposase
MDVYGIEALLGLPEFRVVDQVIGPKRLELHLQRRETSIVCPRCQTCCSRVQESRPRCMRDLPILERPVLLWLHLRRFECQEHRCKGGVILYTVGLLKFNSVGGPACSALCLNALSKRVRSR